LARSVGARVLVDEVYLETLFEARPRTASQLGNEFIATGSLTKAYGLSGLRCGWVFAEANLAEQMRRLNDIYGVIPPHIVERLSVIALENLEAIAGRAKALLETNRKIFDAFAIRVRTSSVKDLNLEPSCFPDCAVEMLMHCGNWRQGSMRRRSFQDGSSKCQTTFGSASGVRAQFSLKG
jgi:aspartate/methionine/tyrosine aminotransferase